MNGPELFRAASRLDGSPAAIFLPRRTQGQPSRTRVIFRHSDSRDEALDDGARRLVASMPIPAPGPAIGSIWQQCLAKSPRRHAWPGRPFRLDKSKEIRARAQRYSSAAYWALARRPAANGRSRIWISHRSRRYPRSKEKRTAGLLLQDGRSTPTTKAICIGRHRSPFPRQRIGIHRSASLIPTG